MFFAGLLILKSRNCLGNEAPMEFGKIMTEMEVWRDFDGCHCGELLHMGLQALQLLNKSFFLLLLEGTFLFFSFSFLSKFVDRPGYNHLILIILCSS